MLAMGRPMGTTPLSSSRQRQYVTSTAASVGPYRLCSPTPGSRSRKRVCVSRGSASPLHTTRVSPVHPAASGSSRNTLSIDGTKCAVVIRSSRTIRAR